MRYQLLFILLAVLLLSCSKTEQMGFLGEWEGKTIIIVDGNPVASAIEAEIIDIDDLTRECSVSANGTTYIFDAIEELGILKYSKVSAKNLTDSIRQTSITGSAEIVSDTLLVFDHEVVTMDGSSIISVVDYTLEFIRKG